MSREEGGECRTGRHGLECCTTRHGLRYRTARHGFLKMAWLSRNLRGNAPPRRTADTLRAAGEPDLLPDVVVVYAGSALFLAAAGGVVFPSCSRGWAAGGAVPAVVTVEITAGTVAAAAVAMRTTVATSPRAAASGWLATLFPVFPRTSRSPSSSSV